jgi:hypothetical protein
MGDLKFIEKAKDNSHFNDLLMPTTMSKSEMKKLTGGALPCSTDCTADGCPSKCFECGLAVVPTCPTKAVACNTLKPLFF